MKQIFILLALLCSAAAARADLVLQQQIATGNYKGAVTMKVKGAKVRLDLYAGQPQAISTILDLTTGDTTTLMHNQKMFVKVSGAQTRQAKSSGTISTASKSPIPRPTGKSEKVGGYDTEIYTWYNARGITGTAWVAKNYPDYPRIRTDLAVLDKSAAEFNNNTDPELSILPGMVVKSLVSGSGQSITATLISAKEEMVDASLFQTPANYRELPRPKPFLNPPPTKTPGK